MNIGLLDIDHTGFPNLALMKLSQYHKQMGDTVGWYTPFEQYDIVYKSKVFTFSKEMEQYINNAEEIIAGGTGYDITSKLPEQAEHLTPDYSIYPGIDKDTAYGYLTRGCPNRCKWCIVPIKEGNIHPYMDVEAVSYGRNKLILMDNNILGSVDYAKEQLEKIIRNGYRVDFNQALDARLVDDDFTELLAKVKWLRYIRFGCDSESQIDDCRKAIIKITGKGYRGHFMIYTMLYGNINECYSRLSHFKYAPYYDRIVVHAQPYIDYTGKNVIPQWQKDMARWANRRWFFKSSDFLSFQFRKGVTGKKLLQIYG